MAKYCKNTLGRRDSGKVSENWDDCPSSENDRSADAGAPLGYAGGHAGGAGRPDRAGTGEREELLVSRDWVADLQAINKLLQVLRYKNFSTPRRGGGKRQWSVVRSKSKLRGKTEMSIAGVKSRAADVAARRHESRVIQARNYLSEIERFLRTLRTGSSDMHPMLRVIEAERNELVANNEVYMQAAAGLWCQSDEPQVLASNLNRERD